MLIEIGVGIALLAAGFGLGRVKNAAKLKAVSTALASVESKASAEEKVVVGRVTAEIRRIL